MTDREQIIIPISKKKLISLGFTCAVFVAIGVRNIIHNPSVGDLFFNNSYLKNSIGGFLILFFGFFLIYLTFKLVDKRPSLIINKEGIIDNSTAVAVGQILWDDIESFKGTKVWSEKFVTPILKDPQKYIDQQNNVLKRKLLIVNFNKNGSPINISTNFLTIKHDELVQLLEKKLSTYNINFKSA
jgi:hypothetical protein